MCLLCLLYPAVHSDASSYLPSKYSSAALEYVTVRPTTKPTVTSKPVPKKNKTIVYKGIKYAVTKSAAKNGTVKVIGVKGAVKSNIVIADTVKLDGYVFNVSEVEDRAFMNKEKIVSVKIGKNVKVIGSKAFKGCKKLKKISGGKVVKKIEKDAFKGCKKLKTKKINGRKVLRK